ncbi:MAG: BatD family protein [Myxococcota bacterium]|nr:BatD family protein [Myxococcota bacterium]
MTSHAQSGRLKVTVDVSDTAVVAGDIVVVEIKATTSMNANINIDVPQYDWAMELGRSQSQSSQFSFGTGGQQVQREQRLSVELQISKEGEFTLQGIQARAGTDKVTAKPVKIRVAKSQQAVATKAIVGQVSPPSAQEGSLFVRYRPNKASAYLGEQILLDLDIFANGNFSLDDTKPPALDGFWREMVDQPTQLRARNTRVNGRPFRTYRLWRMAIFPLEAGKKLVESTQLGFSTNRSIFSTGKKLRRTAPPLELDILPLPTEGRPTGFVSTNVGEYKLTASIDKNNVAPGKAILLKVTLRGTGNIKNTQLPKVEMIDGFRVFPPTIKDDVQITNQGVSGSKTAELILMPTRGGRLEIPSIELTTFNPTTESYETLRTRSFSVYIQGNPDVAAATNVAPQVIAAEPLPSQQTDKDALRPPRFREKLQPTGNPITSQNWFFPTLLAPFLLLMLFISIDGIKAFLSKETESSLRKKIDQATKQRLVAAAQAANSNQPEQAYVEIHEALISFGSEIGGTNIRGQTNDEIRKTLLSLEMNDPLIERLVQELENCDFARFAPGARDATTVNEALERAQNIISELKSWKK